MRETPDGDGMILIGIDPGLFGAMAQISPDGIFVTETPILKTEGRNKYDTKQMWLMLKHLPQEGPCLAILEYSHAMPMNGSIGNHQSGKGAGLWEMALVAAEIPFELVSPQTWKKAMLSDGGKDKAASLVKARQLFPTVDLHRKKDDGKAEALLLAEYGKRKLGGGAC